MASYRPRPAPRLQVSQCVPAEGVACAPAGAWLSLLHLPQEPQGRRRQRSRERPGLGAARRLRQAAVRWARGTVAAASGFPRGPQGWREGATGLAAGMSLGVPAEPRPAPRRIEKQLRAGRGLVTRSPVQGLRGPGKGLASCPRVPRCRCKTCMVREPARGVQREGVRQGALWRLRREGGAELEASEPGLRTQGRETEGERIVGTNAKEGKKKKRNEGQQGE